MCQGEISFVGIIVPWNWVRYRLSERDIVRQNHCSVELGEISFVGTRYRCQNHWSGLSSWCQNHWCSNWVRYRLSERDIAVRIIGLGYLRGVRIIGAATG